MKKLLSLTAATFAALAWVGCSQDGVINEAPSANQAIEFGTYLGRDAQAPTRASVANLDYVKKTGFGVFAYYTGQTLFVSYDKQTTPNFMYNQNVTWPKTGDGAVASEGAWTYAPVKYWPNNKNDLVSFIAYAPYNKDAAPSSTNFTIDYTLPTNSSDTKQGTVTGGQGQDLLYAKVTDQRKQNLNEKVNFAFQHTLCRIGFTVQGAIDITSTKKDDLNSAENNTLDGATKITVNKVILSGKEHKYENNTVKEPTSIDKANVFYKSAALNLLTGNWTSESADRLYFILTPEENFVDTNTAVAETQFELTGAQNEAKQLNNNDSYLMIIPQEFNSSDAETNNDLYVYIEYTVTTTDASLNGGKSEITNYISTPVSIEFKAGNAYTLNLILGLNSVDIEASDAGWSTTTESGKDVNLPENNPGTTGGGAEEPTTPPTGA